MAEAAEYISWGHTHTTPEFFLAFVLVKVLWLNRQNDRQYDVSRHHKGEKEKGRFPIWNQLFILDAELELYQKLVDHSQEASEIFPNQPLCFYFLGFGNSMLDNHKEAIEGYESGLYVIVDNDLLLTQFYTFA